MRGAFLGQHKSALAGRDTCALRLTISQSAEACSLHSFSPEFPQVVRMLGSGKSPATSPKEQRRKGAEKTMDPSRRLGKESLVFRLKSVSVSLHSEETFSVPPVYYLSISMPIFM